MDNLFEKGLVIIFLKMSDSKMISDVDYANFWILDFSPPQICHRDYVMIESWS